MSYAGHHTRTTAPLAVPVVAVAVRRWTPTPAAPLPAVHTDPIGVATAAGLTAHRAEQLVARAERRADHAIALAVAALIFAAVALVAAWASAAAAIPTP